MMLRKIVLVSSLALFVPMIPGEVFAQDTPATPQADPIDSDAAAEDEAPAGPDLSEVNELILEGSYEEAEIELARLLGEHPDDASILLMQGEVLVAQRKLEPAIAALEKCATIDPNRERLHFQLGSALAQLGQNERAIEEFGKELELSDDEKIVMLARLNRTAIFGQMKNWEGAAGELEAVIVLDPSQVQAYGDLVSFYLQAGQLDKASEALGRAAEAGFSSAPHYYSLGARLYRAERFEDASAAFTKALEVDPKHARSERSLGNVYEKLGQGDAAVRHFRRYLELAPDAPDAKRIAELIKKTENG